MLVALLAPMLRRLAPLGDRHGSVAILILPVEACQSALLELFASDKTLLAEHPAGAHGIGVVGTAHETPASTHAALGPGLTALTAELAPRLLEFRLRHTAVAIEIEPSEGAAGALFAMLIPSLLRLLGSQTAVMVAVEAIEPLGGPLDHLLTIDVGAALASRAVGRLGDSRTGNGQQTQAGKDSYVLHDELRSRRW
ncbi:MAG TPA: hypothetical protein VFO69_07665 [Allosphingosinicella sp.]|nr:hypothetical protein [Allosphingosinicella sp.]